MFKKTTLALAAASATLLLTACGGGGGGGSNTSLPGPTVIGDETYAAVYDTVAIIAGADLFARYEDSGSGVNQFGGRPTGDTSLAEGTSPISCGVYTVSSDARIGSALASAPASSGHAAYCSVVHATVSGVLYRHYFKIVKAGTWTTGNPAYEVTSYSDTYNPTLGAHQFNPNVPQTSTVTFSYVGAAITGYTLNGALPATYKSNGDFLNQAGRSVIAINGSRWDAGLTGTRTLGLNGTVSLRSNTDAQTSLRTFNAGSKADVVIGSGGAIGTITLSLQ
ncbi:MAG: hypothetical protein EPO01_08475 [Aquabacterium sp.]|nr:MAG: hypothetical protein EPO01_08475 [Aquabacterium sp.]